MTFPELITAEHGFILRSMISINSAPPPGKWRARATHLSVSDPQAQHRALPERRRHVDRRPEEARHDAIGAAYVAIWGLAGTWGETCSSAAELPFSRAHERESSAALGAGGASR